MNNSPLLSICIPCFGRVDYVRNTLNSIYRNNADVDIDKYEVVISDNDPKQAVSVLANEFKKYPNLRYFHTECEGFMNSYYVLTYAQGEFLKLHNSQTLFRKGALQMIIDEVEKYRNERSLIFFTNGLLGKFKSLEYETFEDFMYALSYWSSWSNGFNIWREDFEKIKDIKLNRLFPHTSLFLTQHQACGYCINDRLLFDVQRIPKRGGHNKFEAFTIEYPSLIEQCQKDGLISMQCEKHIFKDIMVDFLPSLLFNKYIARIETFDSTGFRKNIKKYFPHYAYWLVWVLTFIQPVKIIIRKLKIYLHK